MNGCLQISQDKLESQHLSGNPGIVSGPQVRKRKSAS